MHSMAAYRRVSTARRGFPAPMFCAPSADTVDSMEDGTRNRKLMIFSTMPTAAESFRPRLLAMMVMMMNATWISPSCRATGTPIFSMLPITCLSGRKSAFFRERPVPRRIITRDTPTLTAWARVVPSAAPAGPMFSAPMKT